MRLREFLYFLLLLLLLLILHIFIVNFLRIVVYLFIFFGYVVSIYFKCLLDRLRNKCGRVRNFASKIFKKLWRSVWSFLNDTIPFINININIMLQVFPNAFYACTVSITRIIIPIIINNKFNNLNYKIVNFSTLILVLFPSKLILL